MTDPVLSWTRGLGRRILRRWLLGTGVRLRRGQLRRPPKEDIDLFSLWPVIRKIPVLHRDKKAGPSALPATTLAIAPQ
jgi:hypothetical protein